jgi:hypothetical protein
VTPVFDDLTDLVGNIDLTDAPTFTPSIVALNIPAPPPAIDTSGQPARPTINQPAIPDAPDTVLPATDPMLAISIPDAPDITMPDFSAVLPTLDPSFPTLGLDWAEPTYAPTLLNEVAATVKLMLTGEFGMPGVVQEALFSAAREREDMTAKKAVDDAYDDFAGRGFSMPPGMLVAQVNAAREQSRLQVNALSRDVLSKAADWQIENLRTAVQQGIALESTLINQFNNIAQRAFEMARLRVQIEFDRYNLRVAAYNAQLQAVDAAVKIFQAQVQVQLSKLDVFKAEIEAEQLKGTINEQNIRIYTAKVQALTLTVDMFRTRVEAAKTLADIENAKIELYRADIQAYTEKLQAQKVQFDAYTSQVQGEAAKAGILESEARAFAATVQAYESENNVKIQAIQTKLRAVEAGTQKFLGLVQAEREVVQAGVSELQAKVSTFSSDTQRYSAQVQAGVSQNQVLVSAAEANTRNNIAYFQVLEQQFDQRMNRMIEQSRMLIAAIQAAGQMASQLAAGAMSATHVQAGVNGSGNASLSVANSYSVTTSLDAQNQDSSAS